MLRRKPTRIELKPEDKEEVPALILPSTIKSVGTGLQLLSPEEAALHASQLV